ncbi:hypothetical protein D3C79_686810 [compost metagenome]
MAIADAVVVFQVAFVLRHTMLFQVIRRGTEHQALGSEVLVAKCGRPGIWATDPHHDVDTFVHRVDETVGERHVRLQQWVQADEVQNQGQHMQAAVGGWQFYPDFAMGFVVAGDQCVLDLFQVGQDRGAGTVEDDASLAERQGACGAVEQPCAQAGLQPGHALADGRAGEVEPLCGCREAAQISDGNEYVDAFQAFGGVHGWPC